MRGVLVTLCRTVWGSVLLFQLSIFTRICKSVVFLKYLLSQKMTRV